MKFRYKGQWFSLKEIAAKIPESEILFALQEMFSRGDNLAYFGDYHGSFLFTAKKG